MSNTWVYAVFGFYFLGFSYYLASNFLLGILSKYTELNINVIIYLNIEDGQKQKI